MGILVADDELEILVTMEGYILSQFPKSKLFTVSNGQEAFELVQQERIRILITDLIMPKMNGGELIQKIKDLDQSFHPRHIIIISGFLAPSQIEGLKRTAPGISILPKPFELSKLGFLIESFNRTK